MFLWMFCLRCSLKLFTFVVLAHNPDKFPNRPKSGHSFLLFLNDHSQAWKGFEHKKLRKHQGHNLEQEEGERVINKAPFLLDPALISQFENRAVKTSKGRSKGDQRDVCVSETQGRWGSDRAILILLGIRIKTGSDRPSGLMGDQKASWNGKVDQDHAIWGQTSDRLEWHKNSGFFPSSIPSTHHPNTSSHSLYLDK